VCVTWFLLVVFSVCASILCIITSLDSERGARGRAVIIEPDLLSFTEWIDCVFGNYWDGKGRSQPTVDGSFMGYLGYLYVLSTLGLVFVDYWAWWMGEGKGRQRKGGMFKVMEREIWIWIWIWDMDLNIYSMQSKAKQSRRFYHLELNRID